LAHRAEPGKRPGGLAAAMLAEWRGVGDHGVAVLHLASRDTDVDAESGFPNAWASSV
jgi:hypothetical protein